MSGTVKRLGRNMQKVFSDGVDINSEMEKGLGEVEESDKLPAGKDGKSPDGIWGVRIEIIVFLVAFLYQLSWGIGYLTSTSNPLYQNGTSYISFQKKYLVMGDASNTTRHTRGYLAVDNNGDKYHVQGLFAGLIWGTVAIYAISLAWTVFVVRCSNSYKASGGSQPLWGINHFALYFARGLFYYVCWPIMFFMFGYDTFMSLMAGSLLTLVIAMVTIAMSIYAQVVEDKTIAPVNPVFAAFALFVVALCICTTISFPVTAYIANQGQQSATLAYTSKKPYELAPNYNVNAMFGALMFDLCLNHLSNFIKWIMITVITVFKAQTWWDKAEKQFESCINRYYIDALEHLSVLACGTVFVFHYHASFSNVDWPTV